MKVKHHRSGQDLSTRAFLILVAVIIAFTVWLVATTGARNNANIQDWAQRHGYIVQNVHQWYMFSPFWMWRRRGDAIYQADLVRGGNTRVSYFRCSIWGVTQRWEDGSTDDE